MMFKRKLFVLGVFALAVVTIVGSGFSAWSFTTQRRLDLNTGVNITEAIAFGTIQTEATDWRITLDQSGIKLDKANSGTNVNTASLVTDTNFSDSTTMTAKWYITKAQFEGLYPEAGSGESVSLNGTDLKFYLNLYISAPLKTYVSVGGGFSEVTGIGETGDGAAHGHAGKTSYRIEFTPSSTNAQCSIALGTDDVLISTDSVKNEQYTSGEYYVVTMIYTIPNNLFQYTDKKPSNFAEYRTMVSSMKAYAGTGSNSNSQCTEATDVQAGVKYYMPASADDVVFEFQVQSVPATSNP